MIFCCGVHFSHSWIPRTWMEHSTLMFELIVIVFGMLSTLFHSTCTSPESLLPLFLTRSENSTCLLLWWVHFWCDCHTAREFLVLQSSSISHVLNHLWLLYLCNISVSLSCLLFQIWVVHLREIPSLESNYKMVIDLDSKACLSNQIFLFGYGVLIVAYDWRQFLLNSNREIIMCRSSKSLWCYERVAVTWTNPTGNVVWSI